MWHGAACRRGPSQPSPGELQPAPSPRPQTRGPTALHTGNPFLVAHKLPRERSPTSAQIRGAPKGTEECVLNHMLRCHKRDCGGSFPAVPSPLTVFPSDGCCDQKRQLNTTEPRSGGRSSEIKESAGLKALEGLPASCLCVRLPTGTQSDWIFT